MKRPRSASLAVIHASDWATHADIMIPPMPPRRRSRRIAKWAGAFVCILILVAWFLTIPLLGKSRFVVTWNTGSLHWVLAFSSLSYRQFPLPMTAPPGSVRWLSWTPPVSRGWGGHGLSLPLWYNKQFVSFHLPLWIPLLVVAVPTNLLWFRDARRRFPPGHCPYSGYNLTGNQSGVCPECGKTIDSKTIRSNAVP